MPQPAERQTYGVGERCGGPDSPISSQIYASRDEIRTELIDLARSYMELETVDFTQSSFLSFVIDSMATLSSNLMFYQTNVYREFFLTKAQLPESVHNLSSFIGYSPSDASYAVANLLISIALPFSDPNTEFEIPEEFEFATSDGVVFVTNYTTTISITNNTSVSISADEDGKIYNLPVLIDTTSADNQFQFVLPVKQYKRTTQEFQLDADLQPFQFSTIDIPVDGKVSGLTVYVRDPDASPNDTGRLYTEFDSLYLMTNADYGYVVRTSAEGKRIYFGNGFIGQQPTPGSTVIIYIDETEGASGNVISGSITSGKRIYSVQNSITTIVNYTVTNPSPASSGEDDESIQEIRSNAIRNLTSLNRLVTEDDYINPKVVISDAPITDDSIPVLKRSDLKVNEIQLFTILKFGDDLVPSRNATYTIPSTITYIPRGTVIQVDGINYITLFEMTLDDMNEVAYYHYIMYEIEMTPTLVESWGHVDQDAYNFDSNELLVTVSDSTTSATFELSYYSTENDFDDCECTMTILSTNEAFTMTNVPGTGGGTFTYTFPDYMSIPAGKQTFYFTVSNQNLVHQQLLHQYSATLTFRQDLRSFMLSNTIDDGTTTIIYDIPVVLKSYYDGIETRDFELLVLQEFLSAMVLKDYRMLTDFTNVKFCNSTGYSYNMLRNDVTKQAVKELGRTTIPTSPELADRYIVSGNEGGTWTGHRDEIALCTDATSVTWTFIQPNTNDIVLIEDENKNYVYTPYGWKEPIYEIPLKIRLEVFKDSLSTITEAALMDSIKEEIVSVFEDRFGPNITIHRSEIIDVVQTMEGVSHCQLIEPASSIFYDFNISEFTQQELLEYGPDWIYFTEDDITIIILSEA